MKLRPHSGYCNAVIDGNEFDQWEITAESSSAPHMADRALITISGQQSDTLHFL